MCEPVSITLGVLSAGLGIAQGVAGYQQAQANTAQANAQAEQAFRFQQMQASSARGFEQLKQQQQASVMEQNRLLADTAYANDIAQLNLRLMQEQEAAAQQQRKAALSAQEARGEVRATGRLGSSVDALIADYYRQQAAFDFATERNLAFTTAQTQQQKVGAAATRGSRLASQQPYLMQPILDPLEPIYAQAPSAAPYVLQGAAAVVGGVQTGMASAAQIKNLKLGQPPKLPPISGTQNAGAFKMDALYTPTIKPY
jgi:hypothetical protein